MSTISFLITIAARKKLPQFLELYQERNILTSYITLGHGTARSDMLRVLGLDNSEKAVIFSFITDESWKQLKEDLVNRLYINVPNTGIAVTVPMSSVGGKRELGYLLYNQTYTRGEESIMRETQTELLVVIANQGYNNLVMDAARAAGAAGGTVIHARGTGTERAEMFFGVSLASEKDVILIVTKREQKNAIISSIMEKAGMETEAKAICISLPVSGTAGIRTIDRKE
ncbi:MAG: P-II family nitrogen regulator [Sphaerochaetaceae bacterium]|nr:P-II family nitrogen regulator [Sphaerochaetaceae bacterium]